jgi:hypothetical protein
LTSSIAVNANDLSVGDGLDGILDEVRISSGTVRSADWIETSYNNQSVPGSFYTVGVEEEVSPILEQSAYRWFANVDSTDVGSPLAAQDTPASAPSQGTPFRLRLLQHVGFTTMGLSGESFKLQYAEKSGVCDTSFTGESYGDVSPSAGAIRFYDNTTPGDGDNLTGNANDPAHGGHTTVDQDYEEANNFTNSVSAVNVGQDAMWDFSLTDFSAASATSYCFRIVKADGSLLDGYSMIPEIMTSAGVLDVDIVDSGGSSVGSPSVGMGDISFSFSDQSSSGTLGVTDERIRVTNTTANPQWTLSIAASDGSGALWDFGSSYYFDYNDPTADAGDGGDADVYGGQMTIDPSGATITPEGGCASTGLSLGSSASFEEGVVSSITLLTADATADTSCYWDLFSFAISQTIPAEQTAGSSYLIDMIMTVTAY